MKYRDKNYIGVGALPFILAPVVAITIGLTLLVHDVFSSKPPDSYLVPKVNLFAGHEELSGDTLEFQTGDEAVFNFTGDTVLVLAQPDSLAELEQEVRVLRRTAQGNFETVDLPENWLVKLPVDTVTAQKDSVPVTDKLLQYKKAAK